MRQGPVPSADKHQLAVLAGVPAVRAGRPTRCLRPRLGQMKEEEEMKSDPAAGSPWNKLYDGRLAPARTSSRPNRRAAVRQRFKDLSRFVREFHPGLTPTERAVWLAVYVFSTNGRATVTQTTLAKIGNVTPRAVRTALR